MGECWAPQAERAGHPEAWLQELPFSITWLSWGPTGTRERKGGPASTFSFPHGTPPQQPWQRGAVGRLTHPHPNADQLQRDSSLPGLELPQGLELSWAGGFPFWGIWGWAGRRQRKRPEIEAVSPARPPSPWLCYPAPSLVLSVPPFAPLPTKVIGGRCPSRQATGAPPERRWRPQGGSKTQPRGCHESTSRLPAQQRGHPGGGGHRGMLPGAGIPEKGLKNHPS